MKALPLWQPWATLVAIGAKRVETRHWKAPAFLVGQRIAIHATKTRREMWICLEEPFARRLGDADMWFGAVIATAVLDRCTLMTAESVAALQEADPDEFAFGLYEPGRFAWVLRDVESVDPPVPFRGSQGVFEVPDALLGRDAPQGALL